MKLSTGQIKIQNDKRLVLHGIEGTIEKIALINNKNDLNHIGTFLKVTTDEGEIIIHKQIDNKSGVFYPININAASEFFDAGANRSANVNLTDINQKFFVDGSLHIEIYNAGERGQIENIIVFYQCGAKKILESIQSIYNYMLEMDLKQQYEKIQTKLLGDTNVDQTRGNTGR